MVIIQPITTAMNLAGNQASQWMPAWVGNNRGHRAPPPDQPMSYKPHEREATLRIQVGGDYKLIEKTLK